MESERILELPLNGRNVTELITLGGAAVTGSLGSSPRSMPGQQDIRVAGATAGSVAYSLDGATHNNAYDNLSLPLPFPDALGEFKVETSALSASHGQHSGAQVNAVTKSGTNDVHGDLFEFVRNDLFNARSYFALTHSTLKRNQFGGTIGGPIVKNKLFYFGGYQGTITRSDPANRESYVPTQQALSGDFTTLASPACNNGKQFNLSSSVGFEVNRPANMIDPALYSKAALNLAARLPKTSDPCGKIVWGDIAKDADRQIVGKVDWQANAAHSVLGRVLFTGNTRTPPYELQPDNLLTVCCLGFDNLAQSYALGDTWLKGPNTVVSSRLAANYTDVHRLGAHFFDMAKMGVKNFYSYQDFYSLLSVATPGFSLGGGTQSDSTFRTFAGGLNEDISISHGAHQWSFGGSAIWDESNGNAHVLSPGSFSFNGEWSGGGTTANGLAMADFLLGKLSGFTQSTPNVDYMRKWYLAAYIADVWKINSTLTASYGLRWEPDLAERLTTGQVATYIEKDRIAGIQSTAFAKAPLGFYFPGDPGFPGQKGRHNNWWIFAPRLGLAWDVSGDGRTSVRASGGIGYDYPNAQFHLWTSITEPWGVQVSRPTGTLLDDPWAGYPGGNPYPAQFGKNTFFPTEGSWTVMPYDLQPAQVQSWNLSIQRQVSKDTLVSASYLGSHTIHLLGGDPLNLATYIPGNGDVNGNCFLDGKPVFFTVRPGTPCSTISQNNGRFSQFSNTNLRRRLSLLDFDRVGQYVGNAAMIASAGTSSYNGLLLSIQKRAAKGITFNGNYTWAHCLASQQDQESGNTGISPTTTYTFPGDRNRSRGNCSADRRQVYNLTSVLEMPKFGNKALRMVATGWRLSTIYRHSTGSYLSIAASGTDTARNGTTTGSQPAVYNGANPYLDRSGRPYSFWFNKDAFTNPDVGTFGNFGFRNVVGPSTWQFDMALTRSFQFQESQSLEVRAEAYNVPNSFRPTNPSANRASTQFGQLRGSLDPRILQFALKYVF
jgi:hypothetical protein